MRYLVSQGVVRIVALATGLSKNVFLSPVCVLIPQLAEKIASEARRAEV
jgi:hypothetical protein